MADGDIERLADTAAGPGFLLLGLLSQRGWFIWVTRGFAGGTLVIASHPEFGRVERQGESVAHIAADLVKECASLTAPGRLQ